MNFGFLLFPDAEELDFVGPWEIISAWSKYEDGPEQCLTVSQSGGEIRCAKGLRIVTDYEFADCPPLDYLLIPGGQGTREEVNNDALIEFVKRQAANCREVLSVCTGSFILQAAGLLEGKRATTHWASLERLRQFPEVTVDEQRFVRDGHIWTAAGVSAGIDLALALVLDQSGEDAASRVQLYVEYYPNDKKFGHAHENEQAPAYLKS
ncbi:MAG TPA: DJ-1/PfpI family protein [Pyrinomonadaceae bacterium]|jgi:transcriptional regulator GlxA family with amidase domain|nr:DJ-1/PfpI family protein [Pyrinomonadaceae bacterium]